MLDWIQNASGVISVPTLSGCTQHSWFFQQRLNLADNNATLQQQPHVHIIWNAAAAESNQ